MMLILLIRKKLQFVLIITFLLHHRLFVIIIVISRLILMSIRRRIFISLHLVRRLIMRLGLFEILTRLVLSTMLNRRPIIFRVKLLIIEYTVILISPSFKTRIVWILTKIVSANWASMSISVGIVKIVRIWLPVVVAVSTYISHWRLVAHTSIRPWRRLTS